MCKNIISIKNKQATGYKFVIRDSRGRYVSPITGVIYGIGKIPKPDSTDKRRMKSHGSLAKSGIFGNWLYPEPGTSNYTTQMNGLTGLFNTAKEAMNCGHSHKYIIIKITGNAVATGKYDSHTRIILIDEIYSIEEA